MMYRVIRAQQNIYLSNNIIHRDELFNVRACNVTMKIFVVTSLERSRRGCIEGFIMNLISGGGTEELAGYIV